jgi:hypothetical protein
MNESQFKQALERVQSIEDLAQHLELLLNSGCYVWVEPNGERILVSGRVLVERINGLKIHIYAKEHGPPHFHVVSADINVSFKIEDCSCLEGTVDRRTRDLIVHWHGIARQKLIDIWNRTRPTDCPVGPIHEEQEPSH